ncbi:hypothetical protein FR943_03620 [Mycobacterium sp. TNTM28]|uniref:Uncharacterized protein n=2 Tax=[Mycobacterium] fortunisiensis TaxID=2600579 RepID=A0ABS6KHF7_9MYCO|nr:hypothetical protein [[Mycobacterium] fortunisiensis]
MLAVIAITAVVSISLSSRDEDGNEGPTANTASGSDSEFASANDTGPITIITEDPSCAAWIPINNTFVDTTKNGWRDRDPSIPASAWTPEQRKQYQDVGNALGAAADQTEPLVKLTTHRALRELYAQFIAYARTYADTIPTYTSDDDHLARAATIATKALSAICQAVSFGSAAARVPLVLEGHAPDDVAQPRDPAHSERFLTNPDPVCRDWQAASDQFLTDVADWLKIDPSVPAGQWSTEQKAINDAAIPVMRQSADKLEELGSRSDNPTLQDFATLAAQYRRAYAQAIPTYTTADNHLYDASIFTVGVVNEACKAVGDR